jgi:RNA methyltransferase, TrmH family
MYDNVITSTKSATIKKIQAVLTSRKKRSSYGQTIVEGPRMVFDLLQNPTTASLIQQVLISVDHYQQYKQRMDLILEYSSPQVQLVNESILRACTDTVTPQGIVALVDIPTIVPESGKQYPLYLVLDGVSDPGNMGTLLRSSLAVGVAGVMILPGCCDVWNPKAVRSSMGASFQMPVVDVSDWDDAVRTLIENFRVRQIYGATMMEYDGSDSKSDGDIRSLSHFDIDWLVEPTALVIGSEGAGLSADVRDSIGSVRDVANGTAKIAAVHVPMKEGVESLNAAVCGSVILFEYSRQCAQQLREA